MQSGRHRQILVTNISQLLHYIPAHKSKNLPPKHLPSANQQLLLFLTNYLLCILPLYHRKSTEPQTPHTPEAAQVTVSLQGQMGVF